MKLSVAVLTFVALEFAVARPASAVEILDGTCHRYSAPVTRELESDIAAIRAFVDKKQTFQIVDKDPSAKIVLVSETAERPIFVREVAAALQLIRKTERGREIFSELRERERPVRIVYLRGSAPVWHLLEGSPYSVIFLDPQLLPGTETEEGCDPSSIARVLAHELGHADHEMGETANVNINENPVASDLGEHNRLGYAPGCDPSVKRERDD